MPLPPVLSPAQSDAWDGLAETAGLPRATLMESAARAAAAVIGARYAAALGRGTIVAAGPGNNGGDGWALARALHRLGAPVWVASLPGEASELCAAVSARARSEGVREVPPDGPWPAVSLAVDALLGTGARGAPRPATAALADRLADLSVPIVALDGPTGVDLATGVVHGTARADLSVTFGGVRRGHLLARDEVGEVVVVEIGHPPPASDWPLLITDRWAAERLPVFRASFHKGDRGRVVVTGGAAGMSGALRLAARAAFAAGTGLVRALAPEETVAALRSAEPDVQTALLDLDGDPSGDALDLVSRADALVIGPGLGRAEGRSRLVAALVREARVALLDADAITAFQGRTAELADLARATPLVLTPHPGEFRTLFPDLASLRETDPWEAASRAAAAIGAVVVLKGVPTVVAPGSGASYTVAAGNPGLATGGSGDVLSGIVGAFLAQGLVPVVAGALGAQALGRGADTAARRLTSRALRPMDVIAALADVWRDWTTLASHGAGIHPPVLVELPRPSEI
jgi:NAD(P)H-hydrate epimerase